MTRRRSISSIALLLAVILALQISIRPLQEGTYQIFKLSDNIMHSESTGSGMEPGGDTGGILAGDVEEEVPEELSEDMEEEIPQQEDIERIIEEEKPVEEEKSVEEVTDEVSEETPGEVPEEEAGEVSEETTGEVPEETTDEVAEEEGEVAEEEADEVPEEEMTGEVSENDSIGEAEPEEDGIVSVPEEDQSVGASMAVQSYGAGAIELGTSNIPTTLAGLASAGTRTFSISNYQGWLNLQELSKVSSLEGYTFTILARREGSSDIGNYDFVALNSANATKFQGLGTETTPFKGTLYADYTTGIALKLNTPLFQYLSTKSDIHNLLIEPQGACAGIATELLVDGQNLSFAGFYNIIVSATDTGIQGNVAGGLFANVTNNTGSAFVLKKTADGAGTEVIVNAPVAGQIAGGLIGTQTGDITMVMDGGIQWSPSTTPLTGATAVGGWIGAANNADIIIQSGNASKIEFVNGAVPTVSATNMGGLFGTVSGGSVQLETPLVYTSADEKCDIYGGNAGAFVGKLEQANVTLKKSVTINNIQISQGSISDTEKGMGGFAGVIKSATVDTTAAEATIQINNVTVENVLGAIAHNVGGFVGYAKNAYLLFSNSACTIHNFTSMNTYGNAAGAVGLYEGDSAMSGTVVRNISVTGTTTVSALNGNAAGLIAKMSLANCDVKVEKCYGEKLVYAAKKNISLGIGEITAKETDAKLTVERIVLEGSVNKSDNSSVQVYGGMIGSADIDLVVNGTVDVNGYYDTAVETTTQVWHAPQYYGGLIGAVCQSGNKYREVDIANVLVGNPGYDWRGMSYSYGGLIGKTEDKTSVCLDRKLCMNGGRGISWQSKVISVGKQATEVPYRDFGSVVGSQNHSMIYLQPTAELIKSDQYACNEVGNYGGVFRNGNWDYGTTASDGTWIPDDVASEAKWLIQDHQVTGSWKLYGYGLYNANCPVFEIATIRDWMRLAIFGNTNSRGAEGVDTWADGFYPLEIDGYNSNLDRDSVFWLLLTGDFYISGKSYDLRNTGIVSLYRNDTIGVTGGQDNEGVARYASGVSGSSFVAAETKTTIKYDIVAYSHLYVGLFPCLNSLALSNIPKVVTLENINLEYDINLEKMRYASSATSDRDVEQRVGGLAALTAGDVTLKNIDYTGSIDDNKKQTNNIKNVGGLIGTYEGNPDRTLTISNLTTQMNFTYAHKKSVIGGVIGLVYLPGSGKCNINVTNANLNGTITAEHTEAGASMAASAFITQIYSSSNFQDALYINLTMNDITVGEVTQCAVDTGIEFSSMGGFLGYTWECADVTMNNIKVGQEKTAKLSAKANFGGLVHDVKGRMFIDGLSFGNKTYIDSNGKGSHCGLIVRDGCYLYLDIEASNYTIDNVILENYGDDDFDEIVGENMDGDNEECGGIVNIHTDGTYQLGRNGVAYKSYLYARNVHNVAKDRYKRNKYTRYYYDLDKLDFSIDYKTINSPDALMVWHIMHYANDYIVDYCLEGANGTPVYKANALPSSYTVTGNIDMAGYSIYPTPVFSWESYSAAGATITFNAQGIYDGEKAQAASVTDGLTKYPDKRTRQHSQMQSGLFSNVYGGISVDGLAISGTYSLWKNSDEKAFAGALVCGSIYGIENGTDSQGQQLYKDVISRFTNITLNDLWCVSEEGKLSESNSGISMDRPLGLMICDISAGAKVNLDGIYMNGYTDDAVASGNKAASALIGNVGSEEATYISLNFKNLDIMDAADGKSSASLKSSKKEEVLGKASLIYSYNFKENCSGIYTFTSEDYLVGKLGVTRLQDYEDAGVVTLGEELGNQQYAGINYAEIRYYDNEDPVGMASQREDGSTDNVAEIPFDCYNYLPYVCSGNQEILVNPKIADIEEGCGTYEDPYVISTTTQLMTVYRYLYEEELYSEVLGMLDNEWKIHATGDDTYLCNGTENQLGHGPLLVYEKERSEGSQFPTKEELSQAYYLITDDIDLSTYPEFVGFGREDMPFIGVFVGRGADDESPTITLLEQEAGSTISQYAFIQIAKGVVVKDLNIHFNSSINIDSTTNAIGAGVIGTVVGGDNVIENVSIEAAGNCFSVQKESTIIGGYVGVVELGGVILRNMNAFSLSQFSVGTGSGTIEAYPYVGKIVGRVLDGYVVYDGTQGGEIPLFANTTIGRYVAQGVLPLCSTYDILNGAYLSGSQISWTGAGYEIADNKGLQIMSMALNSGMLNYNSAEGYDADSRQRRADYDGVKNVYSASDPRYVEVKKDNSATFAGSYLWQFLADNSGTGNMLSCANNGGLNPTLSEGGTILTYELIGNEYDMIGFKMGFRGLGARYHGTEYATDHSSNHYITEPQLMFQSNLVGSDAQNQAVIELDMQVTPAMDSYRAALLNEIPNAVLNEDKQLRVANVSLSGNISNQGSKITYYEGESSYWKPEVDYNAAGFASDALLGINFENVTLENLVVDATGYAGGLLGRVRERRTSDVFVNTVVLNHVSVAGGNGSEAAGILNGDAGALIGKVEGSQYIGSKIYIGTTDGTYNNSGFGVDGSDITVYTRGRDSMAGGLIGSVEAYLEKTCVYNSSLRNLTVYTANAYTNGINSAGGILGWGRIGDFHIKNVAIGSEMEDEAVAITLKGQNITLNDDELVISAMNGGVGGFVGNLAGSDYSVIKIEQSNIQGVTNEYGQGTTTVQGYNSVGGFVGVAHNVEMVDCTAQNVILKGLCFVGGGIGASRSDEKVISMRDVEISGCYMSLYTLGKNSSVDVLWQAGVIGGLMGTVESYGTPVQMKGCVVRDCVIAPDYTRAAGGFLGRASRQVTISEVNTIENNVICGDIAGGVFGIYDATVAGNGMENITVSSNKIISCMEHDQSNDWRTDEYLAGGFAGKIDTAIPLAEINKLVISDNLISAYNESNTSYLGGVVGVSNAQTYFYDTQLRDNYIGTLKNGDLQTYAESEWQAEHSEDTTTEYSVMKQQLLKKISADVLKGYLYVKPNGETADGMMVQLSSLTAISENTMHPYAYHQGAVAGKLHSDTARINTFIDLNVQYSDNTYRPVSDVGMIEEMTSMQAVYEAYRPQFLLVYDSKDTEAHVEETQYAGFANLKAIWDEYADTENVDRRYAYRLNENYLAGVYSDIELATIYQETFFKEGIYVSDFVDADGNVIPMLIFRTTDNGTLDEVIQSYVNMLTNNSGALNTYTHQTIEVTTTKMRLADGEVLADANGQSAVQATVADNVYSFVNEADGTRLYDKMTDEKNATFTLIQIDYKYGDKIKWTLEIPVYVEQELEFDSHMRMVKGIEYNVNTVKEGAYCAPDEQKSLGIDSGGSYSLYLEYVYGEARTRYPNAEIPKQLYMASDSEDVRVPFLSGTQMTLIDLEDGNKPYYYTVQPSDGDKIDFTGFKDSENNAYQLKNINECTEYVGESFTDVCNEQKTNVGVERYLLLVDTSNVNATVKESRGNALYALHTDISQMKNIDSRLYNRIDYTEHCIARISETRGMSSVFTDAHTLSGEISKDGNLTLTLEYKVNMSNVWQSANAGNDVYLDLAIGLDKTVNNRTESISLPAGTQVFFEKKTTDAEGNEVFERAETPYVVHGNGINHVYFYGDSGSEMNIMTLPADVDNTETIRVVLDFSMADMSMFEEASEEEIYGIAADLYITTEKESPANGELKDSFGATVVVNVASELGFALQPENILTLGINRYKPAESDSGMIPFKAKIAFPEDYRLSDVQDKYYGIVYRIEEKIVQREGVQKPEYKEYTGSDIVLYAGESVEKGRALTPINSNNGYYQYCSMAYSGLNVFDNIAEAPFVLYAKEGIEYTNYRVTGYLIISDTEILNPTELVQAGELQEDFFVYTVAKVKTEISD